ncbi:hypothetical protein FIA58_020315 [Flavobacterium jejuense]|uniref:MACPF domain-containing protein n=1 Tax=Flavobacterium jejuense TaxID=1544455 RepID=A0ABX0J230_9FLAO|nr:hypothetical protein [Flavobacterium jejuense]NHN28029.1 hypothetical protein [Flavobacterium jejuense]
MKTKLTSFLLFVVLLFIQNVSAQELGEFKPKDDTFGLGKLNSKSKKIYISNFSINYQLFNEKEKTKKGGSLFRDKGVRGDATAELMVGLGSLSENDFQTITNTLYQDFVSDLKSKGFEILSADVAGKTDTYKGWTKASGPKLEVSEMPGIITAYPEDYTFYYKEQTKAGKFFGNKFAAMDKTLQTLSKEMEDAIVVDVDLYVFFMKDLYAFQGNAANIKIKTQLSLVANEAVSAKSNDKGIAFRKKVEYATGINSIQFVCGKYAIGGSAESVYTGTLKKDLIINNVIDEKVIQSYAKGAVDFVGTDTYFGKYYEAENKSSAKTTIIPIDTKKYNEGVVKAGKEFLKYHLDAFSSEFK